MLKTCNCLLALCSFFLFKHIVSGSVGEMDLFLLILIQTKILYRFTIPNNCTVKHTFVFLHYIYLHVCELFFI